MRISSARLLRAAGSNTKQVGKGLVAAYAASLALAIGAAGERHGYANLTHVASLSSGN